MDAPPAIAERQLEEGFGRARGGRGGPVEAPNDARVPRQQAPDSYGVVVNQPAPALHATDSQQALLPKPSPHGTARRPIPRPGAGQTRYTIVLVALITMLLSADQNLLAPNLSAAATFFGLDEGQKDTFLGGYLMAAFFLVGAPAALLCGYCADKFNRVRMLAVIVVLGEAPCLCTYWVTQLWQFFLVRMLTGISVGGTWPLVFSLLGDLAPTSRRAALASVIQLAVGVGIGAGQMMAGLLGPSTNWRLPFVVMAAPTLLLTLLLVATVSEPVRGGCEAGLQGPLASGASYSEAISPRKVVALLRVHSNWIIILQGVFGCLPWGVMQTYVNDYLHTSQGFSVEVATTILLAFGAGCAAGVVAGGALGQALYNWRREALGLLIGGSVIAGVGPILALINADLQSLGLPAALALAGVAGGLVSMAGPNVRAAMLNVNAPEARGVALALQSVTDDLGKGLGPVVVAGFISHLGRRGAFNLAVCAWLPCGLLLSGLTCTLRRDEDAMQAGLAHSMGHIGVLGPSSLTSSSAASMVSGVPEGLESASLDASQQPLRAGLPLSTEEAAGRREEGSGPSFALAYPAYPAGSGGLLISGGSEEGCGAGAAAAAAPLRLHTLRSQHHTVAAEGSVLAGGSSLRRHSLRQLMHRAGPTQQQQQHGWQAAESGPAPAPDPGAIELQQLLAGYGRGSSSSREEELGAQLAGEAPAGPPGGSSLPYPSSPSAAAVAVAAHGDSRDDSGGDSSWQELEQARPHQDGPSEGLQAHTSLGTGTGNASSSSLHMPAAAPGSRDAASEGVDMHRAGSEVVSALPAGARQRRDGGTHRRKGSAPWGGNERVLGEAGEAPTWAG